MIGFEHCRGWRNAASKPNGVTCPPPPDFTYPAPPKPVDTLFVGWNPPGERYFWNDPNDNLRRSLAWVLCKLDWTVTPDFLAELTRRGCYFVHAVKCWRTARPHPPAQVTRTCAKALLASEIECLCPKTLILLGRVPYLAASEVIAGLPSPGEFLFGSGWGGRLEDMTVIITAFPSPLPIPKMGKSARECTLEALRRWWEQRPQ